jgi:hypothetical protein
MSPDEVKDSPDANPEKGSPPSRQRISRRVTDYAQEWRGSYAHPFPVDAWDPVARFVRDMLGWDWPQLFILAFLVYGPIEKLLIPGIGGYLHFGDNIRNWVPDVEALLTGFVEFPFFIAFYMWTGRGIGNAFMGLLENKSFAHESDYVAFLDRAREGFDHWRWTAISFGLAILAVLLAHFVLWGPGTQVKPWFELQETYHRPLALILIGFVGYAVGQILVRELLAIYWLGRLWKELGDDLVVHPYHADDAGGLGSIGQHAMSLSYLALMVTLMFAVGSVLPSLRSEGQLIVRFWNPLVILGWVLYLIIVPLSFGLMLWPPHTWMSKKREQEVNQISKQLDQRLGANKATPYSEVAKLPDTLEEIEHLKAMRATLLEDFPTWPINTEIRRQLRFSSLLPVGHFVFTVALDLLQ